MLYHLLNFTTNVYHWRLNLSTKCAIVGYSYHIVDYIYHIVNHLWSKVHSKCSIVSSKCGILSNFNTNSLNILETPFIAEDIGTSKMTVQNFGWVLLRIRNTYANYEVWEFPLQTSTVQIPNLISSFSISMILTKPPLYLPPVCSFDFPFL